MRAYDVYVSALLLFVASRIVVVVGINFGKLLQPSSIAEQWDAGNAWYDRLLRWDAGWYRSIVDSGYQYSDDPGSYSSTVFYPLYPLVSYFTKTLFGVDAFAALLLVANVSAIAATMLMAKVVKDEAGRDVAVLTVAFFCFFPSSLFLSSGYSESLFLALALLGFLFLQSEAYVFAAISAGFSAATRPTGIVMIPVILIDMALRSRLARPELLPRMALCGLLAALGLLIYMAFLQLEFERPFAFVAGQSAWNQGTFLDRFVAGATLRTLLHSRFLGNGGLFLTFLGLAVACLRCFRFRFPLYALETLALPYFTLGVTSSMERFVPGMLSRVHVPRRPLQAASLARALVDRHIRRTPAPGVRTFFAVVSCRLSVHPVARPQWRRIHNRRLEDCSWLCSPPFAR